MTLFEYNHLAHITGLLTGDLMESFLCITSLGGVYLERLIHGGACFWNFMVSSLIKKHIEKVMDKTLIPSPWTTPMHYLNGLT